VLKQECFWRKRWWRGPQ